MLLIGLFFSAWPDEDDNTKLEKMTRRVEHISGLLAASNKKQSDHFMVRYLKMSLKLTQ